MCNFASTYVNTINSNIMRYYVLIVYKRGWSPTRYETLYMAEMCRQYWQNRGYKTNIKEIRL